MYLVIHAAITVYFVSYNIGSESPAIEKKEKESAMTPARLDPGNLIPSRQHLSPSLSISQHSSLSLQPPLTLNSYLSEQLCDILYRYRGDFLACLLGAFGMTLLLFILLLQIWDARKHVRMASQMFNYR